MEGLHDLCAKYLHAWCLPKLYTPGFQQTDLSTVHFAPRLLCPLWCNPPPLLPLFFLPHLLVPLWVILTPPPWLHLPLIYFTPASFVGPTSLNFFMSIYRPPCPPFSSSFLSRVIPLSQSTCQNWQRRSTKLRSTRDKIWRALCGLMLNTLTPSSLAGSPKR